MVKMGGDAESNLEMRCSADEAWYDGTLGFETEAKDFVIVHFNDFSDEEDETFPTSILLDPVSLKKRVRVRSQQLQDCQCSLVSEGKFICGCLDDGEDRRYYDAKVVSKFKKAHTFKDDGEECKCVFEIVWLDGPRSGRKNRVGCAEVCFLSADNPADDPMVRGLVDQLTGKGRKQAVSKTGPSPKLKADPSKKLKTSSKEPSPVFPLTKLQASKDSSELASLKKGSSFIVNHSSIGRHQPLVKTSVGSKKKRIMQADVTEQPDLASDNDTLETYAKLASTPRAGSDGHSPQSEGLERGEGESTKKGLVPLKKRRLVKAKSPIAASPAPEVAVGERPIAKQVSFRDRLKYNEKKMAEETPVDVGAARDVVAANDEDSEENTNSFYVSERVKSNTKNTASPDVAARDETATATVREDDEVRRPIKMRVKKPSANSAAAGDKPAPIEEDIIPLSKCKDRKKSNAAPDVAEEAPPIVTLSERVKLKSAEKSKLAPQAEASPQKKKPEMEKEKPEAKIPSKKKPGPKKSEKPEKEKEKPEAKIPSKKKPGPKKSEKPEAEAPPQKKPGPKKASQHKNSLQKVGVEIIGKQIQKNQTEAIPSRLNSKPDEAIPSRLPDEATPSTSNDVISTKRKPGRLRKPQAAEPVKPATKKQPLTKEQTQPLPEEQTQPLRQNPQQEEIIDAINAASSDTATKKKRSRTEDTDSDNSTQDEEETPFISKIPCTSPPLPQNNEHRIPQCKAMPQIWKKKPRNDIVVSDEERTPPGKKRTQPCREQSPDPSPVVKKSIADTFRAIERKYGSTSTPPVTPGSSEELVGHKVQESEPESYGKRRWTSQTVLSDDDDDEEEEEVLKKAKRNAHVSVEMEVPTKARRNAHVSVEEEVPEKAKRNAHVSVEEEVPEKAKRNAHVSVEEEVSKKAKRNAHVRVESSANDDNEVECRNDLKTTSTSALDEECQQQQKQENKSRLLYIANMERNVSANDAMEVLQKETDGVCAVHILPAVDDLQTSASGYALYRDHESALNASQHLVEERFVVSSKGRPWIVSQSTKAYGPSLYGLAMNAAFKSDDPSFCGIITDQPLVKDLVVVTKQNDSQAYSQALQRKRLYEEYQQWRKELNDKIVKFEKNQETQG